MWMEDEVACPLEGRDAMRTSVAFGCAVALALLVLSASGRAAEPQRQVVEMLLGRKDVRAGFCVDVGCTDSKFAAALQLDGKFLVHALCLDRTTLGRVRTDIRSQGLYGSVVADHYSPGRLPYPDNLVNVLVVEEAPALVAMGLTVREMLRVTAPYGVAVLGAGARRPCVPC